MIRNILIVDDSAVERQRLETLLLTAGYMVTAVTDGTQALAKAKTHKPDAILMDVNMPNMDGFACARALRADASTKDIPLVFVTAKDQKADKAWGQMLGAKGYIAKPYTDAQVLEQVRTL
jgi:twitching motility two-component system response regulator PilH